MKVESIEISKCKYSYTPDGQCHKLKESDFRYKVSVRYIGLETIKFMFDTRNGAIWFSDTILKVFEQLPDISSEKACEGQVKMKLKSVTKTKRQDMKWFGVDWELEEVE